MIVVGLMSGTSADGTDVAIVEIEGAPPTLDWQLLYHTTVPHPPDLRTAILEAARPETSSVDRLCVLNAALGQQFAQAAAQAIAEGGIEPARVDLIGSHGQTVWHAPEGAPGSTLQLGEAALIAERIGVPVVSNFRARDMAAGGQGAPLVAHVDVLLLTHSDKVRAAQNIGGIANVTFLPPHSRSDLTPFAFDTGPGNVLLDAAAVRATDGRQSCDVDGGLAASGHADAELLDELLAHPYFARRPPKTTGRELFSNTFFEEVWSRARKARLRAEDVVATLTALTVRSIANAYRDFLPAWPQEVIVSGGGTHNRTLMQWLTEALQPARVVPSDAVGIPIDAKEALAFAILAYETWHGRPGNLPLATGAHHPVVLGQITPGRSGRTRP